MKLDRPIVITGFMGCGKSKIARALARRLDVPVVDLDDVITARQGRTPAQLITAGGEATFRAIESDTLRELLKRVRAGVIALGGGAWIDERNRKVMNQYRCVSVWLDVPFEVCWARIETSDEDRPLGKTREQASTLYERRKPIYQLATIHLQPLAHEDIDDLISRLTKKLATEKRGSV